MRHHHNLYFIEQWARVKRWYKKCIQLEESNHAADSEMLDIYLAFFLNVYHLRDWMISWLIENEKKDLAKQIQNEIDNNKYQQIVRDLANGSKHMKLSKPSIASEFSIARDFDPEAKKSRYTIIIGSNHIHFHALALEAINFWYPIIQSVCTKCEATPKYRSDGNLTTYDGKWRKE